MALDPHVTVQATIEVGPPAIGVPVVFGPLLPLAQDKVLRTVVRNDAHQMSSFEITFNDGVGADEALIYIGSSIRISATAPFSPIPEPLIVGDVTAIEARCEGLQTFVVVRGYDRLHRLHRGKHTRIFREETDMTAIEEIILETGLVGEVVPPTPPLMPIVHDCLVQFNQTDYEFIAYRAAEIGYEFGMKDGVFFFRPAAGGANATTVVSAATSIPLLFPPGDVPGVGYLEAFYPRISSAGLTPEVEVRMWDPISGEPLAVPVPTNSEQADITAQPAELAEVSNPSGSTEADVSIDPDLVNPELAESMGEPPVPGAYLVADRPMAQGIGGLVNVEQMALAAANRLGSSFAEAEGYTIGNPNIVPGSTLDIAGVPEQFTGAWVVSRSEHIFDNETKGYRTKFWVGRHELSAPPPPEPPRINGLVPGIVADNQDLEQMRRVRVCLPWLSDDFVSDWARVVQFGAGNAGGALFLPAVCDEVLVGFEHGDIRRPYVLGGLINARINYHRLGLGPEIPAEPGGQIMQRGYVSPAGNKLAFFDDMVPVGPDPIPAGMSPVIESNFGLTNAFDSMGMVVSPTTGTMELSCLPIAPDSDEPVGTMLITAGSLEEVPGGSIVLEVLGGGEIVINAGEVGTVTVNGGSALNLMAGAINLVADEEISMMAPTVSVEAAAISLGL
ncbi:phage baseplate assembly protein V [Streptacidiphilus rugosus]|uniref:phage baseplate assembly protein V n=1 Tax=Streptacidiphilus rugosus TaxID=405783 RepID=UPI000560C415|nr:phage baseplate assembly protein V [Streptacidiphilus rugosus]